MTTSVGRRSALQRGESTFIILETVAKSNLSLPTAVQSVSLPRCALWVIEPVGGSAVYHTLEIDQLIGRVLDVWHIGLQAPIVVQQV